MEQLQISCVIGRIALWIQYRFETYILKSVVIRQRERPYPFS